MKLLETNCTFEKVHPSILPISRRSVGVEVCLELAVWQLLDADRFVIRSAIVHPLDFRIIVDARSTVVP